MLFYERDTSTTQHLLIIWPLKLIFQGVRLIVVTSVAYYLTVQVMDSVENHLTS